MSNFSMPCRDIKSLKPLGQQACQMFLDECKRQGVNIHLTQCLRTAEYQNKLFRVDKTTSLDGYNKKSKHQSGMAWDVACKGPVLYDDKVLAKAGSIARSLGIQWGGYWTNPIDKPHFEISESWQPPVKIKDDKELQEAAKILLDKKIITDISAWDSIESIKLKNVPILLKNMGGTDRLIKDKIVSETIMWTSGTYKVVHVRDLIIKYAKLG